MPKGIYQHKPQQGFQKGHLLLGGGFSGHKHSEFAKREIVIKLDKLRAVGKKFGFQKGYRQTEEHKRNWKLSNKGRIAPNKGIVGIFKHSEKTKQKIKNWQTTNPNRIFKNSSIELKLQNLLKENNIPFETNYPILGRPDIFIKPNICIFADGCYWHKCSECGFEESIRKEREKDQRITQTLQSQGYTVIRLWEHTIKKI